MKKKPIVWYVDDLPENLAKFSQDHSELFEVETFKSAAEVLRALAKSTPDALLCDIFFYDTPEVAREMEDKVRAKAEELRAFGDHIGASKLQNLAGIDLIRNVADRFNEKFPIYAYTSKGPYLLDNPSFDHIGEAGARWLFKRKYSASTEQIIIQHDIQEFRDKNSFSRRVGRFFWAATFGSGVLGGLIVWLLTEVLPKHFR
jgi:hypothetical protein